MFWAQGHGVLFIITFNPPNNFARRHICVNFTREKTDTQKLNLSMAKQLLNKWQHRHSNLGLLNHN